MQRKKSKKRFEKRVFAITFLCVIVGSILRIAYCIANPVQPRDAFGYEKIIREWEKSGELLTHLSYFPLSIWILKIPHHFFKCDIIKSAVVVNIILGLLIIIIATVIASTFTRQYFVILITGLIAATHPYLIEYSCYLLRENLYLLFCLLSIYSLGLYYKRNRLMAAVYGGVLGALAFLCRLEGLEFLFIWFVFTMFLFIKKRISFYKSITHFGLFTISYIATVFIVCRLMHFRSLDFGAIAEKINITS